MKRSLYTRPSLLSFFDLCTPSHCVSGQQSLIVWSLIFLTGSFITLGNCLAEVNWDENKQCLSECIVSYSFLFSPSIPLWLFTPLCITSFQVQMFSLIDEELKAPVFSIHLTYSRLQSLRLYLRETLKVQTIAISLLVVEVPDMLHYQGGNASKYI